MNKTLDSGDPSGRRTPVLRNRLRGDWRDRLQRAFAYRRKLQALDNWDLLRVHVAHNTYRIVEQEAWLVGIDLRARHAFGDHGMVLSDPMSLETAANLAARLRTWSVEPRAPAECRGYHTDIQYVTSVASAIEKMVVRYSNGRGRDFAFEIGSDDDDRALEALCRMADDYADSLD